VALAQLSPRPGGLAVKKIEAFIRHKAFEPIRSALVEEAIRIRTGEGGEEVLQAHTEEEIAAGTQAE
jgi:hypothetical protein